MDSNQFDRLTMWLGGALTRRSFLTGMTAASGALLLGRGPVAAQDATPEVPDDEHGFGQSFLFVQTFTGGTFAANPMAGTPVAAGTPEAGEHGPYLLTLGGHPGQTVYFSDRPDRIVGDAPTDDFIEGLGFGAGDPPNAALVTENTNGETVVAVLELFNPQVDLEAGTVVYEANLLDDYAGDGLGHLFDQRETDVVPAAFGPASLFIDDCFWKTSVTCYKGLTLIGTGKQGSCWKWSKVSCQPCQSANDWCDDTFPECDDRCTGTGVDR